MGASQTNQRFSDDDFGVYLHIPFCKSICSYCNFRKTAAYSPELAARYFAGLHLHLKNWFDSGAPGTNQKISSVFIGGGTPSLFTDLYAPILTLLAPRLTDDCEITLEANVDDITKDRLSFWHSLGFNRLSMGVQSFDDKQLTFLQRRHSSKAALTAIELGRAAFDNVNIDLMYGLPAQSAESFLAELQLSRQLGIPHLSLYNLTYEPATLLGKQQARGILVPMHEDLEAALFEAARIELDAGGYCHEEVSNWALLGYSCRHNWLYWRDLPYLGIGSSAHSYLKENSPPGQRFFYDLSPQEFAAFEPTTGLSNSREQVISALGATLDQRDIDGWILETVWCGLRTDCGVAIDKIAAASGRVFQPTSLLKRGLDEGIVRFLTEEGEIYLQQDHWFRESSWAVEVAMSFRPIGGSSH